MKKMALIIILIIVTAVVMWIYERISRKVKRLRHEKLMADIKSGKRKYDITIDWDKEGFVFRNDKGETNFVRMSWSEIEKITAYKRDLLTTDLICLFFARGDEMGFEVHEESNRWMEFIDALPDFLPGCWPKKLWLPHVTIPPFQPNTTIIFNRREKMSGAPQC
jgi:hypothetical protein